MTCACSALADPVSRLSSCCCPSQWSGLEILYESNIWKLDLVKCDAFFMSITLSIFPLQIALVNDGLSPCQQLLTQSCPTAHHTPSGSLCSLWMTCAEWLCRGSCPKVQSKLKALCRANCLSCLTSTWPLEVALNRSLGTWDGFGLDLTSGNEASLWLLNLILKACS